jgi:phosphatidylglycerophosphatase A
MAPSRNAAVKLDARFMVQRASRLLALGFGSGLAKFAPGTFGTAAAWLGFVLISPWLAEPAWLLIVPIAFVLGVWACGKTAIDLGVADHGAIVWDEIVAFWAVLAIVPHTFGSQLVAFALFRFFDIVKPPPIRYFERTVSGGLGVMIDDLLAAFYTLLVMALWRG